MEVEWDYSDLARAYVKRPDYAGVAIDAMLSVAGLSNRKGKICDVGAGVGHLTRMLAARGHDVNAVEPNDQMRELGIELTSPFSNISWYVGTGESTGQNSDLFDMVTFGSSFNVCDRERALHESARILKEGGWFVCMWNHRVLDDPIQSEVESIIKRHVDRYGYGTRREDQTPIIESTGLWGEVLHLSACIRHEQPVEDYIEAWRSHATLARQAKDRFDEVVNEIADYIRGLEKEKIIITYRTNIWMALLEK